ncbi:OB-fold nucleic acid binding domain-containing protein [Methanolobus sediminis]|uniref:OB-fold nucleic acid binding domain-containing protein n=1 Tax=Methanolobus sediminis TaxID=3072978 RepID=A0AA51YL75_9EURY|nr:OB-fold nucleic acid binding domain-containing protein [Methanolobus sediminis]WMW24657.1 OB-fold nucleic acid binding domain-containing protein [Methanolobus sediminis]
MEKEEKIVVILLCMALFSLAIAYTFFYSGNPADDIKSFSSSSLPGDDVRLEGDILTKRFTYSGDHLLMDVDSGSGIVKVFIPSASGSKDVDSMVNVNDRVLIFGTVSEYEGELEVVVDNSGDVTVL